MPHHSSQLTGVRARHLPRFHRLCAVEGDGLGVQPETSMHAPERRIAGRQQLRGARVHSDDGQQNEGDASDAAADACPQQLQRTFLVTVRNRHCDNESKH